MTLKRSWGEGSGAGQGRREAWGQKEYGLERIEMAGKDEEPEKTLSGEDRKGEGRK